MPTRTNANKTGGNDNRQIRLNLADLGKDEEKPNIVVTILDTNLQPLHTTDADSNGNFNVPQKILEKAHRVTIGPKTREDETVAPEDVLTYRAAQFIDLTKNGTLDISKLIWNKWRFFIKCVTGRVRHCRRNPSWYFDLHRAAIKAKFNVGRNITIPIPSISIPKFANLNRISPSLAELLNPQSACEMICVGTVEVYRRTCCCQPWIINDSRLPELIRDLENIVRVIPDISPVPNPPNPPTEIERAFFKDGTLDEAKINASADLAALRALPKAEIAGYVNTRPHLLCRGFSCSRPVKIATGNINPNGRFNICWSDFPTIMRPFCHREYAFIVRQRIAGITYTIYNGIAVNQWFDRAEDVVLKSYSQNAISCRDNGEPTGEAFVLLDTVGKTKSWNLKTPNATGWDRVAIPAYNDGLAFPTSNPINAEGAFLNCNWGGTLALNYKFSETLKAAGGIYYRVSVAEADANGNPTGDRNYLLNGLSWEKFVVTGITNGIPDMVTQQETLGPFTIGGKDNLYKIPYNSDAAWSSGQFHGYLDTTDLRWDNATKINETIQKKRHLVTIEIFDSAGARLRPNGTPATGLSGTEKQANFTYRRRFQELGPIANVPFAALTHMFWWDNSALTAEIEHLSFDNVASFGECQFLTGTEKIDGKGTDSLFGIGYRAYHPNEMFQLSHRISWKRGLGSTVGYLLASSSKNVGQGSQPGMSPTNTFHQMLHTNPSDPSNPHKLKKCAFTVFLDISAKTTNGDGFGGYTQDTIAFALEITEPPIVIKLPTPVPPTK